MGGQSCISLAALPESHLSCPVPFPVSSRLALSNQETDATIPDPEPAPEPPPPTDDCSILRPHPTHRPTVPPRCPQPLPPTKPPTAPSFPSPRARVRLVPLSSCNGRHVCAPHRSCSANIPAGASW